MHSKSYVHRDVKPQNIVFGKGGNRMILYLVDFGLSQKYIDSKTGKHIKFRNRDKLIGTLKFNSTNALIGLELSRRDDLESLCYLISYLINGQLPWNKLLNIKNKQQKYKEIYKMKKNISSEILMGKGGQEFVLFLEYCKKLKFDEKPNYEYLRGLMVQVLNKKTIYKTLNRHNIFLLSNKTDNCQNNDNDNDSYLDSVSESIDNKIGESMKNYVFSSIMKLEDQNPLHKRKKSLTKLRTFNSNSLSNKIRNDTICNFSTNNTVVNTENNRSTLSNSLLFKKSYFCKYKTPGKKNKINLRGKYKNRFSFPKRKFRQEENNENQCIFV